MAWNPLQPTTKWADPPMTGRSWFGQPFPKPPVRPSQHAENWRSLAMVVTGWNPPKCNYDGYVQVYNQPKNRSRKTRITCIFYNQFSASGVVIGNDKRQ